MNGESLNRRDFLKLKLYALLAFYGMSAPAKTLPAESLGYESVFDKLLNLSFSENVKKEVVLRVALQKKYAFDANGNLHALKRFFNEIGSFIISEKNSRDMQLLLQINHCDIDRIHYLNKSAQYNNIDTLRCIKNTLLEADSATLNEALLYAVKSRSYETTVELLRQRSPLNNKTRETLMELFVREEYIDFREQLGRRHCRFLTNGIATVSNETRRKMQKKGYGYLNELDEFEELVEIIVYNSLVDLYNEHDIDDFSISKRRYKLYLYVWNYSQAYSYDFLRRFETFLRLNGYDDAPRFVENIANGQAFFESTGRVTEDYDEFEHVMDYDQAIYLETH